MGIDRVGVARKELIEAGISACCVRLKPMGFTRHAGDMFTLPLAPRLFGWASLARAVYLGNGSMEIAPVVGLLHQDVERLIAELAHVPYHRWHPATVQTYFGRLTPDGSSVRVSFFPGQPVEEPAERACQPIRVYGLPWMREHASLDAIYALLLAREFNNAAMYPFKLPILAWMLGRPDLSRQHVRDRRRHIEESGGRNTAGALAVWGRFAGALEERMARGAWSPLHGK